VAVTLPVNPLPRPETPTLEGDVAHVVFHEASVAVQQLGFTHGPERPCQHFSRRPGSFCAPAVAALSPSAATATGVSAIAARLVRARPELAPNGLLVSATRTAAKAVMRMPGARVNGGRANE
jgi:hypothetical protein